MVIPRRFRQSPLVDDALVARCRTMRKAPSLSGETSRITLMDRLSLRESARGCCELAACAAPGNRPRSIQPQCAAREQVSQERLQATGGGSATPPSRSASRRADEPGKPVQVKIPCSRRPMMFSTFWSPSLLSNKSTGFAPRPRTYARSHLSALGREPSKSSIAAARAISYRIFLSLTTSHLMNVRNGPTTFPQAHRRRRWKATHPRMGRPYRLSGEKLGPSRALATHDMPSVPHRSIGWK